MRAAAAGTWHLPFGTMQPVAGLTRLTELDLSYQCSTNPLTGLTRVNDMDLSHNALIGNIDALPKLPALTQ
eukprot:gene9512-21821_t